MVLTTVGLGLNFCDALDYILKLAVYTYNLLTFSFVLVTKSVF